MIKNVNLARVAGYLLLPMTTALVFYALFRSDPFPEYFMYSDKVGHFVAFFFLFCVIYWVLRDPLSVSFMLIVLLSLAIGSEYVQASDLLPNRHFGFEDIFANVGGVFVGLVLIKALVVSRKL